MALLIERCCVKHLISWPQLCDIIKDFWITYIVDKNEAWVDIDLLDRKIILEGNLKLTSQVTTMWTDLLEDEFNLCLKNLHTPLNVSISTYKNV